MVEQDVEKRLKNKIDLYEKKFLLEKNPYPAYISLSQFNEIHRKITGEYYVNEDHYEDKYPHVLKKISKIKNDKIIDNAYNYLDFYNYCNSSLPNLLDNTINLLESDNTLPYNFTDINKSDIRPLINEYFNYINLEDKELFDYFYKNNYFINLDTISEDANGVIYFDLLGKEDYIFVSTKDRSNLEIASTSIHEMGHAHDVKNLDKKTKYKYVLETPYLEVPSYMIQNKFYDYLINENINKDFAKIAKYDLIEDGIYDLSNCLTFFNSFNEKNIRKDIDISKNIKYGFGKFLPGFLLNDKETFDKFKDLHYKIYNSSLLTKLDINEDKCKKVFYKEIDKIYK